MCIVSSLYLIKLDFTTHNTPYCFCEGKVTLGVTNYFVEEIVLLVLLSEVLEKSKLNALTYI